MCGIAGIVCWDGRVADGDPSAVVRRMVDALAHRGPDGDGVVAISTRKGSSPAVVALGHRRLSIIDLSARAAQPMTAAEEPVTVTYNGEIYNFAELRGELEARGRRFRSDSDTEVLLQAYLQWGSDMVGRLRGMFAFAIWDGRTGTLLLGRDRLGIKPLYMWRHRGHLLFASEIRALLASGLVPPRLDRVALGQFLAYQTVPSPRTLVEHVEMLPPASILTAAADGDVRVRSYWDLLQTDRDPSPDGARVAVRTRELLAESTACHLVSDVPVGVFLSGGVDSTAIAALVRESGATPRTFAVTFPGTSFDEAPYAAAAARACRAEHTEIPLSEANVLAQITDAIATVDHPSGDGVNTFIVSKAVRDAGIKVALSGLGGDEFFGGYPSFDRLRRFGRYARAWGRSPASMRRMAGATLQRVAGRSVATAKAAALLETDGTVPQTFPILRQLFDRGSRDALLRRDMRDVAATAADPYVGILEHASARQPDADIMTLVSFAEARTYMHDVLLRDTDQMSMRHGLEVRVPLLDHRLVEHLMALPEAAKRPAAGPKPLLIEALGGVLPAECVRRKKQGFVLPFDLWMRGALRPFCDRHLGPRSVVSNTLNADAVSRLWQSFLAGDGSTTWSRPWALVALDAWMERTGVGM